DLSIIDVEVEATVVLENAMRLTEARLEESEVIIERVGESFIPRDALRSIPLSFEARAIALRVVANGAKTIATLRASRVERRVDVDEIDAAIRKRPQRVEAVGMNDSVCHDPDLPLQHVAQS